MKYYLVCEAKVCTY